MASKRFEDTIPRGIVVSFKDERENTRRNSARDGLLRAAETGGAAALRVDDRSLLEKAHSLVDIPIIAGVEYQDALAEAERVVRKGASVVSLIRPAAGLRSFDGSLANIVDSIKRGLGVPVSIDTANIEEALAAVTAGADAITLVNDVTVQIDRTDGHRMLLAFLSQAVKTECRAVPMLADGFFWDRDEIKRAVLAGAHAVLVNDSALDPQSTSEYYSAIVRQAIGVSVRIGEISDARRYEPELTRLVSEQRNPDTLGIDRLSTPQILRLINNEDKKIASLVEGVLPEISETVEVVVDCFKKGGRVLYAGAGTSGRIGITDAAECPPTFGVSPNLVYGLIAGGDTAIRTPVEGAEDSEALGRADVASEGIGDRDVVIGICSSGRTPYVIGVLKEAGERNARTIAIASNPGSKIGEVAEIKIEVVTGPEVILGSTRMKAGTSHKLILNMISTTAMIRIGKVYSNLMIDLDPCNTKLLNRAIRLIEQAAGVSKEAAQDFLETSGRDIKTAIVMAITGVEAQAARRAVEAAEGLVAQAIEIAERSSRSER